MSGADCLLFELKEVFVEARLTPAEIELTLTPEVHEILDTVNGRVLSLIQANDWPKEDYGSFDYLTKGRKLEDLVWKQLSISTREKLIHQLTENQKFFHKREISGLVVNVEKYTDNLNLDPELRKAFASIQREVQFRTPKDMIELTGIEIHLRSVDKPSEVLKLTRKVTNEILHQDTDLHIHILGKYPAESFAKDVDTAALQVTTFIAQSEILSRMVSVVENKIAITDNVQFFQPKNAKVLDSSTSMKPLDAGYLEGTFNELMRVGKHVPVHGKGWVGVKPPGFYSDPQLWGIEYRNIHQNSLNSVTGDILDAIQIRINKSDLGIDEQRLRKLFDSKEKNLFKKDIEIQKRIINMLPRYQMVTPKYFTKKDKTLYSLLNKQDVSKVNGMRIDTAQIKVFKTHHELNFITHDWANDLIFFDQPDLLKKIQSARLKALRRIARKESSINISRDFLLESGIYQKYLEEFGLKIFRP